MADVINEDGTSINAQRYTNCRHSYPRHQLPASGIS